MTTRARITLLITLIAALTLATVATAVAHSINVTPSGICQFMGGPGNPGHPGHAHGHPVALAAERSDAISIGGC